MGFDPDDIDHTEGQYEAAQICLSGHLVNDQADSATERNKVYCEVCGERTITACVACSAKLRGYYLRHSGLRSHGLDRCPAFCYQCGMPHPWTATTLEAAKAMASELEGLTIEERQTLAQSLEDLVRDNPRTQLAATRTKKALTKVAAPAAKALWETIRPIITDAVRKAAGI
jgi:hypothetical protein